MGFSGYPLPFSASTARGQTRSISPETTWSLAKTTSRSLAIAVSTSRQTGPTALRRVTRRFGSSIGRDE